VSIKETLGSSLKGRDITIKILLCAEIFLQRNQEKGGRRTLPSQDKKGQYFLRSRGIIPAFPVTQRKGRNFLLKNEEKD